jgi:hypothetical protein
MARTGTGRGSRRSSFSNMVMCLHSLHVISPRQAVAAFTIDTGVDGKKKNLAGRAALVNERTLGGKSSYAGSLPLRPSITLGHAIDALDRRWGFFMSWHVASSYIRTLRAAEIFFAVPRDACRAAFVGKGEAASAIRPTQGAPEHDRRPRP